MKKILVVVFYLGLLGTRTQVRHTSSQSSRCNASERRHIDETTAVSFSGETGAVGGVSQGQGVQRKLLPRWEECFDACDELMRRNPSVDTLFVVGGTLPNCGVLHP